MATERKAKAPKPPKTTEELVHHALLLAASVGGKAKWLGKSNKALFDQNESNHEAAIKQCLAPTAPLLEKVDDSGRLLPEGFDRISATLPPEEVGPLAKSIAAGLPAHDRVPFLSGVISRTPDVAAELMPVLEEATREEAKEAEARIAATAARRAKEEAAKMALQRAVELIDEGRKARIEALRRELHAAGGDPEPLGKPRLEISERPPVTPRTPQEHGFRREVIRRLVASWREAVESNRAEPARFMEAGIGNVRGVRQVGEPGESVRFDGEFHEADEGVSTGAPVRVVRPGWVIDEEEDRPVVVLKAKVAR